MRGKQQNCVDVKDFVNLLYMIYIDHFVSFLLLSKYYITIYSNKGFSWFWGFCSKTQLS